MKSFLPIFFLLTLTASGQSIDVETEHIKSARQVEVRAFNGCCAKKGYRAVYTFDKDGRAIECANFFKRKLLAKFKYVYNDAGLLTEEIQVYSSNNKNRIDTTHYRYDIDAKGKVLSKTTVHSSRQFWRTDNYKDFDNNGFPKTIISENYSHEQTTLLKSYDTLGNITVIQKIENDSLITVEERKYNRYGDLEYSIFRLLPDAKQMGLPFLSEGEGIQQVKTMNTLMTN
ncbi:MAG TPA: hypothetical protein VJY62_09965 [Bacteroidia bacterium]|nr:hypothetical protein [Bacteroidia bacterium]